MKIIESVTNVTSAKSRSIRGSRAPIVAQYGLINGKPPTDLIRVSIGLRFPSSQRQEYIACHNPNCEIQCGMQIGKIWVCKSHILWAYAIQRAIPEMYISGEISTESSIRRIKRQKDIPDQVKQDVIKWVKSFDPPANNTQ